MAKRHKKNKSLWSLIAIILIAIFMYCQENGYLEGFFTKTKADDAIDAIKEVDGRLEIYFFDVGQADAILVRNKNYNALIDAGNNEDGQKLASYISSLGIKKIDYAIGTHAHEDHIGGMDDIIDAFDIGTFYMPDVITTTKTFEDVLDALEKKGYYFETPIVDSEFSMGDCIFKVLYVGNDDKDLNNTSIILSMQFGNKKFLFTGDAESSVEKEILNKDISSDVLKVGHHGANTSSSLEFLKKVNPSYAIISVGAGNKYNHPNENTLNKLSKLNVKVFRTDEMGTILVKSDGENLTFESVKTDTNG